MNFRFQLLFFAVLLPASALAQYSDFYDRTDWLNSVGEITGTEDFEGFISDTCFGDLLALSDGISVGPSDCTDPGSFNFGKVDVNPFEFEQTDLSGDASASLSNFEGTCFRFSAPISGFGAQFGAINDEILRTHIQLLLDDVLQGTVTPTVTEQDENRFYGFSGPEFDAICFENVEGDGFGVDDIEISGSFVGSVPVPTLGSWGVIAAVLAMLIFGAAWQRRRQALRP